MDHFVSPHTKKHKNPHFWNAGREKYDIFNNQLNINHFVSPDTKIHKNTHFWNAGREKYDFLNNQ